MNNKSLRERLAKIEGLKTGTDLLREQAEALANPPAEEDGEGAPPLVDERGLRVLPGSVVENDFGFYQMAKTRVPLDELHGDERVGGLLEIPCNTLALAARMEPAELDFRRAIFLDTETTSLDSGAGVHVFMIGTGHFEDDAFVVRQYFMRDPSEERAMLADFAEHIATFDLAVSFFGKNFDIPRIRDRFSLNRMTLEFPTAHLDLCHVGRRVWRGRYGNCQLQTLERRVLRFVRQNDLPSADCPIAYFHHVQGLPSRINDVFHHNRLDVISMAVLTTRIDAEVRQPEEPIVRANVARIFEEADRGEEALRLYLAAKEGLWPPPDRRSLVPALTLMKRLSRIYARRGAWDDATCLWQELVDRSLGGLFPHERLAIYYEHVEKNPAMALDHAAIALRLASTEGASATTQTGLRRRVERLEAKQSDA